jgi:hypothetical protein
VTRIPRCLATAAVLLVAAGAAAAPKGSPPKPKVCDGVADSEAIRRLPRESIEDVQPLRENTNRVSGSQAYTGSVLVGALMTVRPLPGLTRERLQRVLECGFALAATEGADTDWPKLPAGTMIKVHSGGDRFFVELRGTNEAAAERVLQAALVYKPRR